MLGNEMRAWESDRREVGRVRVGEVALIPNCFRRDSPRNHDLHRNPANEAGASPGK